MLNLNKDVKGTNTFGRVPSELKYSSVLTVAAGEASITVPSSSAKWLAIFSYEPGAVVWVAVNASAIGAVGTTFTATGSELNPVAYELNGGDVVHFLTSDVSAAMGVSLYAL